MATTRGRLLPDELELLEEELELLEDELELLEEELEVEVEDEELLLDDELLEDEVPAPQPTSAMDAKADRTKRENGFHFISVIEVFRDCLLSIL